jgi:hypothetical protein
MVLVHSNILNLVRTRRIRRTRLKNCGAGSFENLNYLALYVHLVLLLATKFSILSVLHYLNNGVRIFRRPENE